LLVARRDLPPRLQRLDPGPAERAGRDAGGPKILYPPDGSTVEWHGEGVPLEASGGRGPLRWLADGKPLPPGAPRRELFWSPDGVGFTQLTVIDAAGRSAHATVRLEP
jgi:penicillin-binding protein 1C